MNKKLPISSVNLSPISKAIISIFISSVIGFSFSVLITVLFSGIFLSSQTLTNNPKLFLCIALAIGGFISGLLSTIKSKLKGIVAGFISFIIFSLLATVIMLIFSKGHLIESTVTAYIVILISALIGGILGANTKRRK